MLILPVTKYQAMQGYLRSLHMLDSVTLKTKETVTTYVALCIAQLLKTSQYKSASHLITVYIDKIEHSNLVKT